MKLENFLNFKPTNKIKARRQQPYILLSRVLSTVVSQRHCVQLVLCDFEKLWLLVMCKNEFYTTMFIC